jgi:hypothetical protein
MSLRASDGGWTRLIGKAFVLSLGTLAIAGSWIGAEGGWFDHNGRGQKAGKTGVAYHVPAAGTLGYGPPGLHPGFQGFGLGFHPGYGYGGRALGVGVNGGYPFYSGPGYPHPAPCLRCCGGITPFPHYGGPGFPSPGHPNYFGPVGPLVADEPVVRIGGDGAAYVGDYGHFSGVLPYPESAFAPFTAKAAAYGSGLTSR